MKCIAAFAAVLAGQWIAAQALDGAYAPVPGARLFYRDSGGNGIPIVFLHAAAGSSGFWELQIADFRSAGYRFIAFDRRGYGRTQVDAAGGNGSASRDLAGLLDHLGIDRVHLVGTAGGGLVAFDFALSYPKRLRSLVIANSIGSTGGADPQIAAMRPRLAFPRAQELPAELLELGPSYRAANPEGMNRWVELHKRSRAAGVAAGQTYQNALTLAKFETISVPTLLLTGEADLYAPPPLQELFAAHIPKSRTFVIPEAGHSAFWEQPEVFNRAVLAFLREHE